MRKIVIISVLALVLLVACQSDQPATPETLLAPSTPLDVLLTSDMQQRRDLPTAVPESVIADADAEYLLLANIYERITPSVVSIEVITVVDRGVNLTDIANGSGFIYDQNGYIITNAHVANDADEIRVTFDDGYVADAELVGADVYSDIAVVKVDTDSERLLPLSFGDSDLVHVGQRAIAIGNPFGWSGSMTVGIVSAVGRQLSSASLIDNTISPGFQNPHIIQVDTDINPGNSGGPLLNSWGEVIGVNTAISTDSGVFQGVGFAVPANTVQRVVPELIEKGQVDYSWIGIATVASELNLMSLQELLDLPVNAGVLITDVTPGSPADEAGLLGGDREREVRGYAYPICSGGDIIIGVDGRTVRDMDELVAYLVVNTVPGDTINLRIVRDEETFDVPVLLRTRPDGGVPPPEACGGE
jgi:2-alkenal reductase